MNTFKNGIALVIVYLVCITAGVIYLFQWFTTEPSCEAQPIFHSTEQQKLITIRAFSNSELEYQSYIDSTGQPFFWYDAEFSLTDEFGHTMLLFRAVENEEGTPVLQMTNFADLGNPTTTEIKSITIHRE